MSRVRTFFLKERGITADTLAAFGIVDKEEWLVIPYPNGEKLRKHDEDNKRVFVSSGNMPDLLVSPKSGESKTAFLCEGETDTLRLWQALREAPMASQGHVYGLGGINTWEPKFSHYFEEYERVYVILDNDSDYKVKAVVDKTWKQIRLALGSKARRIILPMGAKDICEFFNTGTLQMLSELCKRKRIPGTTLKRLDLTKEPGPMDWLVEGLICKSDVNLVIGNPGIGKSWLMMDLALAVAGGREEWVGKRVNNKGPVLYVDEENPEDIIYHRFKKLGINDQAASNIFYLYRPGIWLNKEPDTLLEEAAEIEPSLIILDSLSRIHSEDENNANAMARLFREAIVPLSRETGASVIVIHHTIKSETDNSFQRARGSGDLGAVVDAAFDVRGSDTPGRLFLSQYKSRRSLGSEIISVQIRDKDGGQVELIGSEEQLPF